MAGAEFKIQVDDAEIRDTLARLGQPGTDDLMPRVGEYLMGSTKDRFKTQTDPSGTPWPALSKRYVKRKKYNADKVLTLRGYLRSGIRYQPDGPDAVRVGTNSPYGAIHQFGGTITMKARQALVHLRSVASRVLFAKKSHKDAKERQVSIPEHKVNMPARAYLGVSTQDKARVIDIVREWVKERAGG